MTSSIGFADPFRRKGRLMEFECPPGGLGAGDRERVERLRFAPGNRNLGPDHIDEVAAGARLLRDGAKVRGAFGDHSLRELWSSAQAMLVSRWTLEKPAST